MSFTPEENKLIEILKDYRIGPMEISRLVDDIKPLLARVPINYRVDQINRELHALEKKQHQLMDEKLEIIKSDEWAEYCRNRVD